MNYIYPPTPKTRTLRSSCKSVSIVYEIHENVQKNIKYLLIKLIFSFMLISIVFAAPETTDSAIVLKKLNSSELFF